MRKEYFSPEFDLTKFKFETILDNNYLRPSDNHTPTEDGDQGLDQ